MALSIKTKLAGALVALTLCVLAVGACGFFALRSVTQRIDEVVQNNVVPMEQLRIVSDMYAVNIVDTTWKAQSNQITWTNALKNVQDALGNIDKGWKAYLPSIGDANERQLADQASSLMKSGDGAVTKLIGILKERDESALRMFATDELYKAIDPITVKLGELNALQLTQARDQGMEARSTASSATILLLAVAGGALLMGALALAFVISGIVRPLGGMTDAMKRLAQGEQDVTVPSVGRRDEIGDMAGALQIFQENAARVRALEEQERAAAAARLARAQSMEAVVSDVSEVVAAAAAGDFSARLQIDDSDEQMQRLVAGINEINAVVDGATTEFADILQSIAGGDLTRQIGTGYRGRFADLKNAINETVDRLSATVATIQTTSADVGLAAREISMGADDLSKRTEEQASSLEQTAATTEELAASVKASAQASRAAATAADEAASAARSGGTIAGQAVDAMARIETASQKISDIIRVIDDIAFQTNLLALNAAVEAARAGDAGKGFAVVASEVRTLAQRSSEAAKDISTLISSSNAEVGEGVKLVRKAGEALTQILSASQKVASTIADISAASGEQANGIDEMSQAVAHLDEMTQQNAALSEQSAASANSLSGRIEQLNNLVATFRTNQGQGASTRAPVSTGSEPERLRQLAEAAFHQSRRPAAAEARPAEVKPAPVKRAVNARNGSTGWEEF
ncbi:methyl-accepting chemotaxis protein [Bosea sp. ASV33]|uniref:HAMP domain-containing methyl-accepting chemotaxis protein n=1 Tax=Bosea sp. ASV33 TaxID=2795106 RepID=UPI0018ED0F79|nr:methyl-accepting chemotaxis protein [Bosea sp. ASV33]